MTSNQRNWTVFIAAAALTGAASIAYLSQAGITDDNIRLLLRLSANVAFVVLLVVFAARPLRQIYATPTTRWLLQNRRLLGIAFAGIHTAHLAMIFFRANHNPDFEINLAASYIGVITYSIIYLMFITSFDGPARALGPRAWRVLHKLGLYFIGAIFARTLLPPSLDKLDDMNWWLAALTVSAIGIRLIAFFTKRRKTGALAP